MWNYICLENPAAFNQLAVIIKIVWLAKVTFLGKMGFSILLIEFVFVIISGITELFAYPFTKSKSTVTSISNFTFVPSLTCMKNPSLFIETVSRPEFRHYLRKR